MTLRSRTCLLTSLHGLFVDNRSLVLAFRPWLSSSGPGLLGLLISSVDARQLPARPRCLLFFSRVSSKVSGSSAWSGRPLAEACGSAKPRCWARNLSESPHSQTLRFFCNCYGQPVQWAGQHDDNHYFCLQQSFF